MRVPLRRFMFGKPDYIEEAKEIIGELARAVTYAVIEVLDSEGYL